MTTATLEPSPSTHLEAALDRNLRALTSRHPNLVDQIRNIETSMAVATVGRDGVPTFLLPTEDGRTCWLGRCSTPGVRAEALVDGLGSFGDNTVVPAVGNGYEVKELLRRLPRHAAVFVVDTNLPDVALALMLHDFSTDLANGRLIFLTSPDMSAELVDWFERFPGYEYPQRMLKMSAVDHGAFDTVRGIIEQSAAKVAATHHRLLQSLEQKLADRSVQKITRLAIISLDPRDSVVDATDAISRCATSLNLQSETCVPNTPGECHTMARMSAVTNTDATLIINAGWGSLLPWIPESHAAASWLLPDACLLSGQTDGFSVRHRIFAATTEVRDRVVSLDANPDHVTVLEPGCDEAAFDHDTRANARAMDVVIVGDPADLSPDACGITYSSHAQLWDTIRDVAARHRELSADAVLQRAESMCDIRLNDEPLRHRLTNIIRDRLIPTVSRISAAQTLANAGHRVHVFGVSWNPYKSQNLTIHEARTDAHSWWPVFSDTTVVIWTSRHPTIAQSCLEAFACGAMVALPTSTFDMEEKHPQLSEVFRLSATFSSPIELVGMTARLISNRIDRNRIVQSAQSAIRARHLIRHRLETILEAING